MIQRATRPQLQTVSTTSVATHSSIWLTRPVLHLGLLFMLEVVARQLALQLQVANACRGIANNGNADVTCVVWHSSVDLRGINLTAAQR